jgi:hypothetical protein
VYVCVHTYVCTCMYVYVYSCTYIHIYVHAYVSMHIYSHYNSLTGLISPPQVQYIPRNLHTQSVNTHKHTYIHLLIHIHIHKSVSQTSLLLPKCSISLEIRTFTDNEQTGHEVIEFDESNVSHMSQAEDTSLEERLKAMVWSMGCDTTAVVGANLREYAFLHFAEDTVVHRYIHVCIHK